MKFCFRLTRCLGVWNSGSTAFPCGNNPGPRAGKRLYLEDEILISSIRNAFATALLASAAVVLAGCPTVPGATIPGMSDLTGASPSPTPATTASAAPTAADCATDKPAATPESGKAELGAYAYKSLPNGWNAAYNTEAEVTAGIKNQEGKDSWACWQKFYPDAYAVYLTKKDAPTADAEATPAAESEEE